MGKWLRFGFGQNSTGNDGPDFQQIRKHQARWLVGNSAFKGHLCRQGEAGFLITAIITRTKYSALCTSIMYQVPSVIHKEAGSPCCKVARLLVAAQGATKQTLAAATITHQAPASSSVSLLNAVNAVMCVRPRQESAGSAWEKRGTL